MNAKLTGERVLEDLYQSSSTGRNIYLMHIASYEFARELCFGKNVLDLGCGSGYGSHFLAADAHSIVGVDVDIDSINYAKDKYKHQNLIFLPIESGAPLPFESEKFDVILSFQVIEHVWDDSAYVAETRRLLKKGGTIIMITPDRKNRLFPNQQPWNRWHIREYSEKTIRTLVEKEFVVESVLTMTAKMSIAQQELSRYRKNKYLLLPFTLPGVPYVIRKNMLTAIHKIYGLNTLFKNKNIDMGTIDIKDILFSKNSPFSLNLVCIGKKS